MIPPIKRCFGELKSIEVEALVLCGEPIWLRAKNYRKENVSKGESQKCGCQHQGSTVCRQRKGCLL